MEGIKSHMLRLCCTAQFVAALLLAGCGTVEVFGKYDLPEDPSVESTPYPRLVDTPTAPAVGEYSAAVPDPERGAGVTRDLTTEAALASVRARELSAPILSDAERNALFRKARAAQRARKAAEAEAKRKAAEE